MPCSTSSAAWARSSSTRSRDPAWCERRWGWYVLPLLFGDRLVGRIEPRIDRSAGAMRDALRAYLRFAGATGLEWAPHLATEKRLFRTHP